MVLYFQETPNGKDSKNKKKKERKKNEVNKDKQNPRGADAKPSENEYFDEASQVVMENTGCEVK